MEIGTIFSNIFSRTFKAKNIYASLIALTIAVVSALAVFLIFGMGSIQILMQYANNPEGLIELVTNDFSILISAVIAIVLSLITFGVLSNIIPYFIMHKIQYPEESLFSGYGKSFVYLLKYLPVGLVLGLFFSGINYIAEMLTIVPVLGTVLIILSLVYMYFGILHAISTLYKENSISKSIVAGVINPFTKFVHTMKIMLASFLATLIMFVIYAVLILVAVAIGFLSLGIGIAFGVLSTLIMIALFHIFSASIAYDTTEN